MRSNTKYNELKKELNNSKEICLCAEQFGLVGDPTRMKICWLLCKHRELSVGEIADILKVSISVVSHSLKKLKQFDMVNSRKNNQHVFYRLSNTSFNKLLKLNLSNL